MKTGSFKKDYSTDGLFSLRYNCIIMSLRGALVLPKQSPNIGRLLRRKKHPPRNDIVHIKNR